MSARLIIFLIYFAEMAIVCLLAWLPVWLGLEVQNRWGRGRGIAVMFAGWIVLFSAFLSTMFWFHDAQCQFDPTLEDCPQTSRLMVDRFPPKDGS